MFPSPPRQNNHGVPPAAATSPRPNSPWEGRIVILLVLAVVLLVVAGVYTAQNLPQRCGLFGSMRHGLDCSVPLPDGARFVSFTAERDAHDDKYSDGNGTWTFAVPHTSYQRLHAFYAQALIDTGWVCEGVGGPFDTSMATPGAYAGHFVGGHASIYLNKPTDDKFLSLDFSLPGHQDGPDTVGEALVKIKVVAVDWAGACHPLS